MERGAAAAHAAEIGAQRGENQKPTDVYDDCEPVFVERGVPLFLIELEDGFVAASFVMHLRLESNMVFEGADSGGEPWTENLDAGPHSVSFDWNNDDGEFAVTVDERDARRLGGQGRLLPDDDELPAPSWFRRSSGGPRNRAVNMVLMNDGIYTSVSFARRDD